MARTNSEAVRGVMSTDTDLNLTPFIRTANVLTNWLADQDAALDNLLDAATLTEIETYLAAHFVAHRDQQYSSKSTGGSSASFQGQTGMVLSATLYGQTAMMLDSTGMLAKRSADASSGVAKVRVSARWAGTPSQSPLADGSETE